jgi:asparagine synthase (glutamine-hydrolysing)
MLPGSFWTVIQDSASTVVIGDLANRARVYFAVVDGGVWWSTAATPLAACVGGGVRPELLVLDMVVRGIPSFGGETPFAGVRAVQPGWLLTIDRDGHRVERWYTASEAGSYTQTAALFRDLIIDTTERHAERSPVLTSALSGGIDSGILAVLAARHRRVLALTYVEDPDAVDLEVAGQIVRSQPGLDHEIIEVDDTMLPYAWLDHPGALPVTDLPSTSLAIFGPERAVLDRAAAAGSTDHLVGWSGDRLLSAGAASLAGVLCSGRPVAALRGALAHARDERSSSTRVCLALLQMATSSHRASLRRAARTLRQGGLDPNREVTGWQQELNRACLLGAAGWLTDDAADWVVLQLEQLAHTAPEHNDPERAGDWWEVRQAAARTAGFEAFAASHGIVIHAPFCDSRLLDACLALPGRKREPFGSFKPLVTEACADLIPAALAQRTAKDDLGMSRAVRRGLRRHSHTIRELIDGSALISAHLLDGFAVRSRLESLIAGADDDVDSLNQLIVAELWLTQQHHRRQAWWEENS